MGAEDGADLGDEGRLAAEDLVAVFDQGVGGLLVLDVLDDPAVGAGVLALAGVVTHPLQRSGAGADPLDGRDLLLQGEDRLDLEGAADPGAGAADPPTAPQVLERVDRKPHLQRPPRLLAPRQHRLGVPPGGGRGGGAEGAEAHAAGRRARIHQVQALAVLALVDQPLPGLPRGLEVPEMPAEMWIETISRPSASSGSYTA